MDSIALQFYKILGWFNPENDPNEDWIQKPFSNPEDNIEQIAGSFYESTSRNIQESTAAVKVIIEKQKLAIEYLKQNITMALISEEPFVREYARLIYLDQNKK